MPIKENKYSSATDFFILARRCAILFGTIHLIALICFATLIGWTAGQEAQWQVSWMFFVLADIPVSSLMFAIDWPSFHIPFLPYPFDEFQSFVFPCLFFGILGTIWYAIIGFTLGSIVSGLAHFGKPRTQSKTVN